MIGMQYTFILIFTYISKKYYKHSESNFFFLIFRVKQKNLNRLKLIPIIECILLCGRQEIALRGHRDSGPIHFEGQ